MRYQGKITSWKDDQGFGFVIPNGGGEKAFIHIKAFTGRSRRPLEGDFITYEQRQSTRNVVFRLQTSGLWVSL
jgi:cold shock CspA family protein